MSQTCLSYGYSRFGPAPDVLEPRETPLPQPGPNEVLIRLSHSGVNPSDVKARAGARPGVTEPPYPFITPHSDGAGEIISRGANVAPDRLGQRVWIWNGQWQRPAGTNATHILLPETQAVPLPQQTPFETGAQLGIPGLTAAHTVLAGGPLNGQTVLIHGGAGSVGYLAVQLARRAGARVITTARGAGLDRARNAGASAALDYTSPDLPEQILEAAGGPVPFIIDVEFGQNIDTNAAVIAENGTICAYGSAKAMRPDIPFGPLMFKAVTLKLALIYILPPRERSEAITLLDAALRDSDFDGPVARIFDLENSAAAHIAVENGGRGGAILVDCQ